ncbi:MAG: GNAT family N-acetyltransferase [Prevotella sp.]
MISAEIYSSERFREWNDFVAASKNGTFLFDRRYMDYHSARFADHSIMFYDEKHRLVAVLPANAEDDVLQSHHGLTYGGLVVGDAFRTAMALETMEAMNACLRRDGFHRVVYKPTPWIYHRQASEEDLYAIFRKCDFRIIGRDISIVVDLSCPLPFMELRRRHAAKALREGVTVEWSRDFSDFWTVLDDNLMQRYGAHPVHSADEINMLVERFPENIVLCRATLHGATIAGVVMFVCGKTVHVQYISASQEGKKNGALDAIFFYLINYFSSRKSYFDFGKSTEDMGRYLNEGLIFQKEGFGGRGVCYDTYEWTL